MIRNPDIPATKEVLIRLFGAVERNDGLLKSEWYDAYWVGGKSKPEHEQAAVSIPF